MVQAFAVTKLCELHAFLRHAQYFMTEKRVLYVSVSYSGDGPFDFRLIMQQSRIAKSGLSLPNRHAILS